MWSTPVNWDSGSRPGSNDDAIFPTGFGNTVALDVSIGAAGPNDILRTDNLVGGSTSTVLTMTGDGTLRLNPDGNNYSPALVAVLRGGTPVIDTFNVDLVNDEVTFGIAALQGVRYLLDGFLEVENWYDIEEFIGGGVSSAETE